MTTAAWVFYGLAALAALADWVSVSVGSRSGERVAKPLVIVALIGAAIAIQPHDEAVRAWLLVGLVFALMGDAFLAGPTRFFLPGLVCFAFMHVYYVVAFALAGIRSAVVVAALVMLVLPLAFFGLAIVRSVRDRASPLLSVAVGGYAGLVTTMVAFGIGTEAGLVIAGSLSFYFSDALLGWNRFVEPVLHGRTITHVSYHLGQGAIVGWLAT